MCLKITQLHTWQGIIPSYIKFTNKFFKLRLVADSNCLNLNNQWVEQMKLRKRRVMYTCVAKGWQNSRSLGQK